jgi:amidase
VALRPSPGLVPQGPNALPFQVLSVIGSIARSVADVALSLDSMSRFDPHDPPTRPRPRRSYHEAARSPARPDRAAFSRDLGVSPGSASMRTVVSQAVERLTSAGLDLVADAEADLLRWAAWCEAVPGVSLPAPIDPKPA